MIRVIRRISGSSLGRRLAGGLFWTTFAGILGRLFSLLGGIALARLLGKQSYGEFSMIQGTVGTFAALSGVGIGLTATKHIAEYRNNQKDATAEVIALSNSVSLVSGFLVSVILALLAGTLARKAFGAPELETPVRISALLLFLSTASGAQIGILSGFEAFRSIATISLIGGVASIIALLCGALFLGVNGAVWGLLIGQAATTILGHRATTRVAGKHGIVLRLWGGGSLVRLLWQFSLPAALGSMVVGPVNWVCSAILVQSGGGFGEVGILNAANQWFGLMTFLPGLLGQASIPMMSERFSHGDHAAPRRVLLASSSINGVVAGGILAILWLLGPLIARAYGRGFEGTPAVLNVALITGAVVAVQSPVGHIIAASGRMWTGFAMNLGWAICFIVGTLYLVRGGALGVSHARLIAYVVIAALSGWYAWRVLLTGRPMPQISPPGHSEDAAHAKDLT